MEHTPNRQFDQGLKTIHEALRSALEQQGIPFAYIAYTTEKVDLRPQDTTFIVATKNNRTESLVFTRSEISNSAQSIDSYANAKVRLLVRRIRLSPNV